MTEVQRYKKRLRAAFLLLQLCPKCGRKCSSKYRAVDKIYFKNITCVVHGTISNTPPMDLWADLERYDGV